ncbi:hypothetical protein [Haladaptatus sp.]|uniref:hypothetical protein n=1 Tax=Haladaptatus sp. TaxID=1973141 RepID=UPI003C56C845
MNRTERSEHFASLFESITGQPTITEPQQTDIPVRLDESGEGETISHYLATAGANELDDVINEPDTY